MAFFQSDAETDARLASICAKCGETFGRHKFPENECPLIEGKRTVGYMSNQHFEEWPEDIQEWNESNGQGD